MRVELAWVDALLSRWGRWSIRCESGALGFASSCILGGAIGDSDGYDSAIPRGVLDDDMEAVDGAIRLLPAVQRECVMQVYKHGAGWSDERNAKAIGISYKSLTQYINLAHRKLALDISLQCTENHAQSVNGGIAPERIQPVPARA